RLIGGVPRWALAAVAFFAVLPGTAHAATMVVTNTVDTQSFDAGGCMLRDAISAANNNTTVGGCLGDTAGTDTIVLQGGQTYSTDNVRAVGHPNLNRHPALSGPG